MDELELLKDDEGNPRLLMGYPIAINRSGWEGFDAGTVRVEKSAPPRQREDGVYEMEFRFTVLPLPVAEAAKRSGLTERDLVSGLAVDGRDSKRETERQRIHYAAYAAGGDSIIVRKPYGGFITMGCWEVEFVHGGKRRMWWGTADELVKRFREANGP